jgi:hypothetical protein
VDPSRGLSSRLLNAPRAAVGRRLFGRLARHERRHALVRDAAYRLLTEVDRRQGHLAAGCWLEAMGDADAMVLAGHAREGGDMGRAVTFYTIAATYAGG